MKNLQELFYEKITNMQKFSAEFNFKACTTISTNLITSAILFEYKDGVFIGEVFEGVFGQLAGLIEQFELDNEDREFLKKSFEKNLGLIAESFTKSDKSKLYCALSDLRYDATKMQYKCIETNKSSRKNRIIPFPDL